MCIPVSRVISSEPPPSPRGEAGASPRRFNAAGADLLLVPVGPEPLPVRALARYAEVLRDTRAASPHIRGPFLSMVDRRKTLHRDAVATLPAAHAAVTDVVVPATVQVERMGTERSPLARYAPTAEAAKAYAALWENVRSAIKLKPRSRKR